MVMSTKQIVSTVAVGLLVGAYAVSPKIRENVDHAAGNISATLRYGSLDATETYRETSIGLRFSTTPAEFAPNPIFAEYVRKANGLRTVNDVINPGSTMNSVVYDPNGRRLSDLIDALPEKTK
jgi:hypothetical protein